MMVMLFRPVQSIKQGLIRAHIIFLSHGSQRNDSNLLIQIFAPFFLRVRQVKENGGKMTQIMCAPRKITIFQFKDCYFNRILSFDIWEQSFILGKIESLHFQFTISWVISSTVVRTIIGRKDKLDHHYSLFPLPPVKNSHFKAFN